MSNKKNIGQILDCHVASMTAAGRGKIHALGTRVEIDHAVAGDRLKIKIVNARPDHCLAKIEEIHARPYDFIDVKCEHADNSLDNRLKCGGCSLQHLKYSDQLKIKKIIVESALNRNDIGHIKVNDVIPSPKQWYYRNKMELSFGPDHDEIGLGIHPKNYKFEVVSLKQCHLLDENMTSVSQAVLQWAKDLGLQFFNFRKNSGLLRLLTFRQNRFGQTMIILTTSGEKEIPCKNGMKNVEEIVESFKNLILSVADTSKLTSLYHTAIDAVTGRKTRYVDTLLYGQASIEEELRPSEKKLRFEILPRAFFQPNVEQAERLYGHIVELAKDSLKENSRVLDLYCGTGTIALSFASAGMRCIGIDIEEQAIKNAEYNAKYNNVAEDAIFYAGDVAKVLEEEKIAGHFDVVVIDPPRRGLLPNAYRQVIGLNVETIVYVSCNPETLSDDLKKFLRDGYVIDEIQPFDMLPQTPHVECVVKLHVAKES